MFRHTSSDDPHLSPAVLRRTGTTLNQLQALISTFSAARCSLHFTGTGSEQQFRAALRSCYGGGAEAGSVCLVNYDMAKLGQPYAGHICPVAAFDDQSACCLLLDVWAGYVRAALSAPWSQPPSHVDRFTACACRRGLWVNVVDLWNAMCVSANEAWKLRTSDDASETRLERGYLLVSLLRDPLHQSMCLIFAPDVLQLIASYAS
jgi:hypothetical protein